MQGTLSFLCGATPLRGLLGLKCRLLTLQGINIKGKVIIGPGLFVAVPSRLTLGEKAVLGPEASIMCYDTIDVGDDFLSAIGLTLHRGSHNPETLELDSAPITSTIVSARTHPSGSRLLREGYFIFASTPLLSHAFPRSTESSNPLFPTSVS